MSADEDREAQVDSFIAIASQVFGAPINPEEAFFDMGGDSLQALEIAIQIKIASGIEVDTYQMVNAVSLGAFFQSIVAGELPATGDSNVK
jgi:acyl carrier protein